jgi:hypothetical protein
MITSVTYLGRLDLDLHQVPKLGSRPLAIIVEDVTLFDIGDLLDEFRTKLGKFP